MNSYGGVMKRFIALFLSCLLIISSCGSGSSKIANIAPYHDNYHSKILDFALVMEKEFGIKFDTDLDPSVNEFSRDCTYTYPINRDILVSFDYAIPVNTTDSSIFQDIYSKIYLEIINKYVLYLSSYGFYGTSRENPAIEINLDEIPEFVFNGLSSDNRSSLFTLADKYGTSIAIRLDPPFGTDSSGDILFARYYDTLDDFIDDSCIIFFIHYGYNAVIEE